MPEPLHIPATVTCLPPNSNVHATSLLLVSVVIIASAASLASSLLLPSTLERAVTPDLILSIGSCLPITPVDATRTAVLGMFKAAAASAAVSAQ